jgi:glycosyltransferase involved in cell wall biosynthesis
MNIVKHPARHTLSVCMIVKNEAGLIGRCLESIKNIADEIIVVDTGSDDATPAIAERMRAIVIRSDWRDDFSYSRNISLSSACGEWILWLDADDVIPPSSIPVINDLKTRAPDRVFSFVVKNEKPGNTGSEFMQARMFPNRPDIRFERRIHEQMMPSALRLGMPLEKTTAVIEHHGYADEEKVREKSGRNVRLLLAEWNEKRPDAVMAVEIADAYFTLGDFEKAESWYRTVLAVPGCVASMPEIASQAFMGIGNVKNREKKFTDAIDFLKKSVRLCPSRTDALFSLAVAQDLSGDLAAAAHTLKAIIAVPPATLGVGIDFREATIKAYLRLERIMNHLGRREEMLALCRTALVTLSHRPEIQNMAGRVFFRSGILMDALHAFEKSLAIDVPSNCEAYIGLCQIYLAAGKRETAEQTMRNIKPLFEAKPVFWAFWQILFGSNGNATALPLGVDQAAVDKEIAALMKFFPKQ